MWAQIWWNGKHSSQNKNNLKLMHVLTLTFKCTAKRYYRDSIWEKGDSQAFCVFQWELTLPHLPWSLFCSKTELQELLCCIILIRQEQNFCAFCPTCVFALSCMYGLVNTSLVSLYCQWFLLQLYKWCMSLSQVILPLSTFFSLIFFFVWS